jgi:hypothetical protein
VVAAEGGGGSWRNVIAGTMLALILGFLAGAVALVLGIRLAEARGVSNYCGERAAWSLVWVALPATVVTLGLGY